MLTRRCTQRMFFFVPGGKTEALFEYALACAAKFAGVKIIGWCLMSNHYHILVYDPYGTLAMFLHHLNMQLARSFNAYLGRGENLFANDSLSRVELVKAEDVVDKLAYTLANPVQAGLVGTASAWGGSTSWNLMMRGECLHVPRPKIYHRTCRDKFGDLTLHLADELLGTREVFVAHVKAKVRTIELQVETERRANHQKVMGMEAVRAQKPMTTPMRRHAMWGLRPKVACKSKWDRIAALQANRAFIAEHAAAKARLLAGEVANFPRGTVAMWQLVEAKYLRAPWPPVDLNQRDERGTLVFD